jgi:hypothetical protein
LTRRLGGGGVSCFLLGVMVMMVRIDEPGTQIACHFLIAQSGAER